MHRVFLFESGSTGWSGSFKSCYYIASALEKRADFSVTVGCFNESVYWEKLKQQGIPVIRFCNNFYTLKRKDNIFFRVLRNVDWQTKKWFGFLPFSLEGIVNRNFIKELKDFLRKKKIDLIHANTSLFRDMEILAIAKELRLPIVCHFRGYPYRNLTMTEKELVRYKKVEFVAVSKAIKMAWTQAGVPENKITVIYNAQRDLPQKIKNKLVLSLEKNEKIVHLLFIGRLSKIKGLDTLIKALDMIKENNWHLSIVGDGEEKDYFLNMARNSRVEKKIKFEGYQANINEFFIQSDVVIAPYLKDSCPRTVIEAMQFALPVIASNVEGPAELVDDGRTGIHFAVGDAASLAKAIEFLLKNPEKRKEFGLAGREKQKRLFSEEVFMEQLIRVYDKTLRN